MMRRNLLLEDAIARDIPPNTHVLIGILPWGLGHAARCIPIIEALQHRQCVVKIYTGRESYLLLSDRFPATAIVDGDLPQVYLKGNSTLLHLLRNLHVLLMYWFKSRNFIRKERKILRKQVLISDNLPGFYSDVARLNIYITHQIKVINRDLKVSDLLSWLHYQLWKKYDLCWIPDDPAIRLGGEMSAPPPKKHQYIGLLSRLIPNTGLTAEHRRILILLSGPEPHRSNLEQLLIQCIGSLYIDEVTLVRGVPENRSSKTSYPGHWKVFHVLQEAQMEKEIRNAGTIITRCGYSTLMEIHQTGARIICIPTPGQCEQEYLATKLAGNGKTRLIVQEKILSDLPSILVS
jgi:predicted glycosyltransferase